MPDEGTGVRDGYLVPRTSAEQWLIRLGTLADPPVVSLACSLSTTVAWAFDPHEFGWDSDPDVAKTKFCITNDGYNWNNQAIYRAEDARATIENNVPGFNVILSTNLIGCHLGDARVEIDWRACPIIDNAYIAVTWWDYDLPEGWVGTKLIDMIKWKDCDNLTDSGLVKWDFDPNDGIGSSQVDFQEVLQHEMGHALGLHHPEAAGIIQTRPGESTRPAMSFDGRTDVILMRDETTPGERHVRLTQDDVSGFSWLDTRHYLARPMEADYWGTFQGSVLEESGYLVLTKDAGVPDDDYSYMYMTTRMSTDGRDAERETPDFRVQWRKTNGQSQNDQDRVRLRIAYRPVYSDGSVGAWAYIWKTAPCLDEHADNTWEWCTASFTIGDYEVQDIRVYIYNSTLGRIQINSIELEDGA